MDFMHDQLADNRAYRLLTIVDIYSRECVALEVAPRFCSDDVVAVLRRACRERGMPKILRCDNGTEFVAKPLGQWAFWNKVGLDFSRPGKPTDNAFIESFNGGVRRELLNPSYFETIDQARTAARVWRDEYNDVRPHSMLANRTPKSLPPQLESNHEADFLTLVLVHQPGEAHWPSPGLSGCPPKRVKSSFAISALRRAR
jgi:putative transposase